MKELVLFVALVLATSFSVYSKAPIYNNVVVVDKYEYSPGGNNILFISSPFAKSNLDAPDNFKDYKGRKIVKVTYLYSQNNIHPTFNQNSLSDNRYKNLMTLFPELKNQEGVEWETQVQSACGDIQCAKQLYHGFIIEFEDKEPEAFTQSYLNTEYFTMHSDQCKIIKTESGSRISIPTDAFVRKDGQEVSGDIYVSVKEGVEVEDILFGGLYTMTDENQVLESGGMVEIKAYNAGYELELKEGKTISVNLAGSDMKDGMQLYTGVQTENGLTWNDPQPLVPPKKVEANVDEEEMDEVNDVVLIEFGMGEQKIMKYPIRRIQHSKTGDKISSITILFMDNEHTFNRNSYDVAKGQKIGLSDGQANQIQTFFNTNDASVIPWNFWGTPYEVEEEVLDTVEYIKQDGTWLTGNFNWVTGDGRAKEGTNSFQEDTEVRDAFQMSNLGWANIDRLAYFPNSKKVKFAVNVELPDSIEDIKISMVVPDKKMYLPGYKKKDGNYSFTHGDYEEHTFPIGDKAVIIAIVEKDGETWFDMAEITLGENEIENLSLEKTEREEAINLIKETV